MPQKFIFSGLGMIVVGGLFMVLFPPAPLWGVVVVLGAAFLIYGLYLMSLPEPTETDQREDFSAARLAPLGRPQLDTAPSGRTPFDPPAVKPEKWSGDVIDLIEWRRFEALVERLIQLSGHTTSSQTHGPDGGVDITFESQEAGQLRTTLVQCKHWRKRVGVDKVRELIGIRTARGCDAAMLVTSSGFTDDAKALAASSGVVLVDRPMLERRIQLRTEEEQQELLAVALEGDYWRPTCASCGIKLVPRDAADGRTFWGCSNYPRCRSRIFVKANAR